jgi:glycyl-tRNA synthetase beta chain
MTKMVFEFPSLQGIMGRYYARQERRAPAGGPGDGRGLYAPPRRRPAARQRQRPGGGHRRPAGHPGGHLRHRPAAERRQGPLRPAPGRPGRTAHPHRGELELDLEELLKVAVPKSSPAELDATQAVAEVFDFVMERLKAYYADRGIAIDVVDAVLACRPTRPAGLRPPHPRGERIPAAGRGRDPGRRQQAHPQHPARRPRNASLDRPDPALFQDDAERELFAALEALRRCWPAIRCRGLQRRP